MDDYIKREDVERLICSECCIGFCQKNMCRIINRLKEEIPAADVRENVRGEWVERKDIYPHKPDGEITSWTYKCSRCNQLSQLKYDFCFNCGADMRGMNDV